MHTSIPPADYTSTVSCDILHIHLVVGFLFCFKVDSEKRGVRYSRTWHADIQIKLVSGSFLPVITTIPIWWLLVGEQKIEILVCAGSNSHKRIKYFWALLTNICWFPALVKSLCVEVHADDFLLYESGSRTILVVDSRDDLPIIFRTIA